MAWRVAKSLEKMRAQANEIFPARNKAADGTIGDASHASRSSDHNPHVDDGVVTALDLTHDPGEGMDTWEIAEHLRKSKDPRIKYVISNGRIFSSTSSPWSWRKYTGSNRHAHHIHVSVKASKTHYDDTSPWNLVPEGWRPTLRVGDSGSFVRQMQTLLGITADGKFGPTTKDRLQQFQATHGLQMDGVCGRATWSELESAKPSPAVETA